MQKVAGLLVFALVAVMLAGCSFSMGADEPGKKWIAMIEKHKKALEDGKFDAAAFKTEAKPLAEELKKHRDKKEKKVLLSETVLADFKRVSNEFETLLKEKGTPEQQQAYLDMIKIWTTDEEPADNAPAND
ncbi:MAG: hypothetical protein H6839_00845 [Planctomycetes bacterium]|nr:hypothetical protein [Planctomycetota bacterium]